MPIQAQRDVEREFHRSRPMGRIQRWGTTPWGGAPGAGAPVSCTIEQLQPLGRCKTRMAFISSV